jgi:hypothetical protein
MQKLFEQTMLTIVMPSKNTNHGGYGPAMFFSYSLTDADTSSTDNTFQVLSM